MYRKAALDGSMEARIEKRRSVKHLNYEKYYNIDCPNIIYLIWI